MLYNLAFLIFSIFYLPTLLFKGKLHRDFLERFGIYRKDKRDLLLDSKKGSIWIQAVSVGEVALCRNLVILLKTRFPDQKIIISTITKTGNDLAKKIFAGSATVIYFPIDFSPIVKKTVSLIKPDLYIMIETEIWPNLLSEISGNNIPSILINGRISDRSFGKYKLARLFLKSTLQRIKIFCMQSEIDAERIVYLGAPKERVRVTGNMKFDVDLAVNKESLDKVKQMLGLLPDEKLLVAGSTHSGEEKALVRVYGKILREFPNIRLLIAPRHIERFREVEGVAKRFGFIPVRFSKLNDPRSTIHDSRIFILDTIGELNAIYSIADLVFIGGSLIKHGGQNPIEPATFEKPILFGPYMFNFKVIANALVDNDAAVKVLSEDELLNELRLLLKDSQRANTLGRNAKRVVSEKRGATIRNLKAIEELIGR